MVSTHSIDHPSAHWCIGSASLREHHPQLFPQSQHPSVHPSCTPSNSVAQNSRDISGTSPSGLFLQQEARWQQRPPRPALVSRIHTSFSHHAPHQCCDPGEEWNIQRSILAFVTNHGFLASSKCPGLRIGTRSLQQCKDPTKLLSIAKHLKRAIES